MYNKITTFIKVFVFATIGPVIGYSKTSETEHYTVGIHICIPL